MSIIFIGSYSEMITADFGGQGKGIYTLKLNGKTGELALLNTTTSINSGYLTIHKNGTHLYAIKEVILEKKPVVKSYKINEDYSLQFLNEQSIPGSLPCHITFNDAAVLVSCYGTGNILRFPVNKEGLLLPFTHNYIHTGSSLNKERQEAPHVHQTVIHPDKKHVFIPDLGIDKVKVYELNANNITPKESLDIAIPQGQGPRHMVFNKNGNTGYLINELTGNVSILKRENNTFHFFKNIKSLPDSFNETPSASAIRIHPYKPILYAANRTFDAITIFALNNDDLEVIDYQLTQGKTLREFNISPNGNWLIACLQDSNETIVYHIKPNGKLSEKYRTTAITSPVCVAFL